MTPEVLARLAEHMPTLCWIAQADGYIVWYNRRWHDYCGTTAAEMEGWGWQRVHDPETLPRVKERWQQSIVTGEPFEMTFPLRGADGEYRPFLTRVTPWRDQSGQVRHWFGTNTDVSERVRIAEQNELLSRELSHRIKNIFAIVDSLVTMTARHDPTIRQAARELSERIAALGRAHDFARPHSDASMPGYDGLTLQGLIGQLLAPYPALYEGRIMVSGDDVAIDDRGATPIALLVHELATNAAKYGALSTEDGHVDVVLERSDRQLTLRWDERGGPPVTGPPTRHGFGSQLAAASVERQLGGMLTHDWRPAGLRLTAKFQLARLTRPANG